MTSPERRSTRSDSRLRVRLSTAGDETVITGVTRDISQVGMFIQTRYLLPPGTPVKIEVIDDGPAAKFEGIVAQFSKLKPGESGVQMQGIGVALELTPEQIEALVARPGA